MTQEPSQSLTETVLSTAASGIFLSTKQPLTTASQQQQQQQRLLMEVRVWVILASQHVVLTGEIFDGDDLAKKKVFYRRSASSLQKLARATQTDGGDGSLQEGMGLCRQSHNAQVLCLP